MVKVATETDMTSSSPFRRPAIALLTLLSAVPLASCQTSADEVLSIGDSAPSEDMAATVPAGKAFRDPYVVAVSGQPGSPEQALPQNETEPARLKRQPVPMAAAFADIAEPPPEVLALQQQAMQGRAQASDSRSQPAPADLGELTMQPTAVNAGNNSLFSAGRANAQAVAADASPAATAVAEAGAAASPSLVPSEMPTLGVNAVRKSLFSPSPQQQALMQQQALQEQAAASTPEGLPLTEAAAVAGDEPPVLKKLSDPRPKRKILALREPTATVPERVQLTPDQLQAMGAVPEYDPAEPLPAGEQTVADAEAPTKKKKWLPSLSDLLKGGKKQETAGASD